MIIPREDYYQKITNALRYVSVIALTGARQVGKTTIMTSVKLNKQSILLNCQDPEIIELFQKLSSIEQFAKINLNKELNGYLLLDEFQFIPKVSTMMKLLTDKHKNLKIICTGSFSLEIEGKIDESLAGRIRVIMVQPLSFTEYVRFTNNSLYEKYSNYSKLTKSNIIDKEIVILFNEYLIYGGLPRVALAKKTKDKIELLNDIYKTYLLRDVRNFIRTQDFVHFNNLLKLISANISNLLNINELSKLSQLPYRLCKDYLAILEGMNIIRTISPFNSNKRKELTKMKKVYFVDNGLRNIIYNSFQNIDLRLDNGALFENYILSSLSQKVINNENIYYYRTKDDFEIDFIVKAFDKTHLFEAKFSKFDKAIKINRFETFGKINSYTDAYVINQNLNARINNTRFIPGYLMDKIKI